MKDIELTDPVYFGCWTHFLDKLGIWTLHLGKWEFFVNLGGRVLFGGPSVRDPIILGPYWVRMIFGTPQCFERGASLKRNLATMYGS